MGHIFKQHGKGFNWVKYYREGRPIRESTKCKAYEDAKEFLKRREGAIASGVPLSSKSIRLKVDDLLDDVVNEYQINGRRSTKDVERRARMHLLPFFGGRKASSITSADVRQFVKTRQRGRSTREEIEQECAALGRNYAAAILAAEAKLGAFARALRKKLGELKRGHHVAAQKARHKAGPSNAEINGN